MLDDVVGGASPLGGVQRRFRGPELVDNADEGTRSHRWPDGEDSHAHHSSLCLGDDDRRGGDEEEVAEEVCLAASGVWIGVGARKDANGGVQIGQAGGRPAVGQLDEGETQVPECSASIRLMYPGFLRMNLSTTGQ